MEWGYASSCLPIAFIATYPASSIKSSGVSRTEDLVLAVRLGLFSGTVRQTRSRRRSIPFHPRLPLNRRRNAWNFRSRDWFK